MFMCFWDRVRNGIDEEWWSGVRSDCCRHTQHVLHCCTFYCDAPRSRKPTWSYKCQKSAFWNSVELIGTKCNLNSDLDFHDDDINGQLGNCCEELLVMNWLIDLVPCFSLKMEFPQICERSSYYLSRSLTEVRFLTKLQLILAAQV